MVAAECFLADAPSCQRDVQAITRRVGERTAVAGRRIGVRGAAFGVRRAKFGRTPQSAIRRRGRTRSAVAFCASDDFALAGAGERRECLIFVPLVRCLGSVYLEIDLSSRSVFFATERQD